MNHLNTLNAFLKRWQRRSFETGVNDCAMFIAGWVEELTGHDHAADFRGKYDTDLAAARMLRKAGYRNLSDFVVSTLNEVATPLESPLMAKRGDVVIIEQHKQKICGIVAGPSVAVIARDGLAYLSVELIVAAWTLDEVK